MVNKTNNSQGKNHEMWMLDTKVFQVSPEDGLCLSPLGTSDAHVKVLCLFKVSCRGMSLIKQCLSRACQGLQFCNCIRLWLVVAVNRADQHCSLGSRSNF